MNMSKRRLWFPSISRAWTRSARTSARCPEEMRAGQAPVAEAEAGAGRRLRQAESLAYWTMIAPAAALLPARAAYRVACWRGDLTRRLWPQKRAEIVRDLRRVLGDEVGEGAAGRLAREVFRLRSCEIMDVMRLRGSARPLAKLVEIRGREHLQAALAGGKGAILSVVHASGIPLTTMGRWDWKYDTGVSSVERRFWNLVYARRVLRHRQRPNIEPWPGRVQVAVEAAAALRANEVVTIAGDAAPLHAERAGVIEMPFLGRQARLMPGVITLARLTGAPVLMAFVRRSPDYRHQVLEISPPVPMDGETKTAFGRCAAAIDTAVTTSPADWHFWLEPEVLARLGLLPAAPPIETAAVSRQPARG
jgi:lauroyl/myristoyl acyltransferase